MKLRVLGLAAIALAVAAGAAVSRPAQHAGWVDQARLLGADKDLDNWLGYGRTFAEQRFSPAGFAMPLGLKDVGLALGAGEAKRVPLPFAGVLRDGFLEALAGGGEELDWSALALVAARRAHLGD